MNCVQVQSLLDARLDGELTPQVEREIVAHVRDCAACRANWVAAQTLKIALRELPIAPPRTGFEDRVLARARARARSPEMSLRARRGALALAAGLLVAVAAWLGARTATEPMPAYAAGTGEPLRLVFRSETALRDVTIELDLPAGTALRGHPGARVISWQSDLASGTNVLELPLVVDGPGGLLVARLAHAGETRAFRVRVLGERTATGANDDA